MGKYSPLIEYLEQYPGDRVGLAFGEVERIIGATLPESAKHYRAWWANERFGSHNWATGWMEAGWRLDRVSFDDGRVWFKRDSGP